MSLQITAATSELAFTGTIPSLTASWTISFWYYHHPEIGDGGEYRVVWANHSGAFVNFAALTVTGTAMAIWKFDLFGVGGLNFATLSAGWHHITIFNVDAQQIGLFVDGVFATGVDLGSPGTFVDNGAMVFGSFAGDPSFALYDAGAAEQGRIEDVKLVVGGALPEPSTQMHLKRPAFIDDGIVMSWAPMIQGEIGSEGSLAKDELGYGHGDWAITDMLFARSAPQSYDGSDDDILIWPAPQILLPGGVGSSEAVGALALSRRLALAGIGSAERVGSVLFAHAFSPGGIASAEAVGSLALAHVLAIAGVASAEAVGGLALAPTIVLEGIGSGEAVGALALAHVLLPGGVPSSEGVGSPTLTFFVLPATVVMTLQARRGQVAAPGRIGASLNRQSTAGGVDLELKAGPTQLHSLYAGHVGGTAEKI